MGKLIDPKKKNSIMVGENTATPSDIAELFGRNPDMTNYVAPQAAAQTVAQPTAGYGQRMQQEADASQARVDDYFKKNPMTGDVFQDIGGLLATREDRKRATKAREYMEAEEGRGVTRRGQDITKELGLGEIAVNKDANQVAKMGHALDFTADTGRTAAYEKGQNQQFELGKGELDHNKNIFNQTAERYKKYGEPADIMSLTEKAANTKTGADSLGLKLGDEAFATVNRFVQSDSVAKPTQPMLEESDTMYNKVPEQFSEPVTGIPTASNEYRGVSPIFQAANLGVMLGKQINRAATPPRSSLRRRVKKVQ